MKQLLIILLLAAGLPLFAQKVQKPVLDTSVFNKWPSVGDGQISPDGLYVTYTINNRPAGSHTLVVRSTRNSWKREFPRVDPGKISSDSKRFIFKTAGDSLCIRQLGSDTRQYIPNVRSYQLKGQYLVYQTIKTEEVILLHLQSQKERHYSAVMDYLLSDNGNALLIKTKNVVDNTYSLQWVNTADGRSKTIWQGESAFNTVFNPANDGLAFTTNEAKGNQEHLSIWYYKQGMEAAVIKVNDGSPGIDPNLRVATDWPVFDPNGDRIYFRLIEKALPKAKPGAVQVNVWSYKDYPTQAYQQYYQRGPKNYWATMDLWDNRVIRIEQENEELLNWTLRAPVKETDLLFVKDMLNNGESDWHEPQPSFWLVSARDGSQKVLNDKFNVSPRLYYGFPSSNNGKWLIYFDPEQKAYFSYEMATGIKRNITRSIPVSLIDNDLASGDVNTENSPVGVGAWLHDDSAVLIYDDYDTWKVDPMAIKPPVNITRGYGRAHHIQFRLSFDVASGYYFNPETLILRAFSPVTKFSGLCQVHLDGKQDPDVSGIGPFNCTVRCKARNKDVWIVQRMSATDAPNYFATRDFKTYQPLSDLTPQKNYNWLTAELVNWTMLDGKPSQGILYKPENFDPTKKYPVIFLYYQKRSDGLYEFKVPEACIGPINIPWFVSHGYLVFSPDIYYKIGHTGESVVNSVVSAAQYLSKMPWVDSKRMGINGHSFGGFETNYLVTHSQIFAAAATAAGASDMVSTYGAITGRAITEPVGGQYRMSPTMWQRPDLYIENSPVLKADQVTTPLLMMHNKGDIAVPFEQGIEFYTALRRLGKKVWLLQYDQGGHGVVGKDALDYTIRLTQFFDHYLKDAPPPRWMTEGIPARLKGVESRLELDTSGKQP